ncbi:hypothetical protein TXIAM_20033 [Tenacibaculum xiamenense]
MSCHLFQNITSYSILNLYSNKKIIELLTNVKKTVAVLTKILSCFLTKLRYIYHPIKY